MRCTTATPISSIVMLPIWQAEFGLSYAAVGALRGVLAGTMAGFQIPSGMLSERLGTPLVLAAGTALAGLGYCLALFAGSFPALIAVLFLVGARREHAASARLRAGGARVLRARARSRRSAPTISPAISERWRCPAAGALLVTMLPWRVTLALIGAVGSRGGGCAAAAHAALPGGSSEDRERRRRPRRRRAGRLSMRCSRSA